MVDTKFNNGEKNDGCDFGIFDIKMTAVVGMFRKAMNELILKLKFTPMEVKILKQIQQQRITPGPVS